MVLDCGIVYDPKTISVFGIQWWITDHYNYATLSKVVQPVKTVKSSTVLKITNCDN